MNINGINFIQKTKMLHPEEAQAGAARLLERTANGDMGMEILPNSYAQFTGELEEKDYISYCEFLSSANGRKVIDLLEEDHEGELLEL